MTELNELITIIRTRIDGVEKTLSEWKEILGDEFDGTSETLFENEDNADLLSEIINNECKTEGCDTDLKVHGG